MENDETIKLLRECNSGVKMGISAIDEVLNSVKDPKLSDILIESKNKHEEYEDELSKLLSEYKVLEKEPGVMAKTMSWVKTNFKLAVDESDNTVAGLITDGCNMGVKSLVEYLNQYKNADDRVRSLVKKVIETEEHMITRMKKYL